MHQISNHTPLILGDLSDIYNLKKKEEREREREVRTVYSLKHRCFTKHVLFSLKFLKDAD